MSRFPTLPESVRKLVPEGVSLFARPEKRRWVFSYETGAGRSQRIVPGDITDPRGALDYLLNYLKQKGVDPTKALTQKRAEGVSLDVCANRWLELCERDTRVAPATLAGYRSQLTNWIRPTFGSLAIAAIEVPALRAWIREMTTKTAPRTVQHIVSTMARLFDCALAEGWLDALANVIHHPGVRDVIPPAPPTKAVRMSTEAAQQLLNCADVSLENRARYAVAFTSGLRDGEIAGLRCSRLRLVGDTLALDVEDAVALIGEKGKDAFAKVKATKNLGSVRTIPLHPVAISALVEWLSMGWPDLVGRPPRPDDFLFPRPSGKGSRPRSAEKVREDLERAGLASKQGEKSINFKDTRSSFVTWLDEAGVPEGARKKLMGHRSRDVTESHYTVRELSALAAAVATIPLMWTPGTVPAEVPSGTTEQAKLLNLLAPPALFENATFGLGKGSRRRRRGAGRSVKPTPVESKRTESIGAAKGKGTRKRRNRGASSGSVVPRELVEVHVGVVIQRGMWEAFDAADWVGFGDKEGGEK